MPNRARHPELNGPGPSAGIHWQGAAFCAAHPETGASKNHHLVISSASKQLFIDETHTCVVLCNLYVIADYSMTRNRRPTDQIQILVVRLAEQAPVPMLVLSHTNKILFANTAFAALLGSTPDALKVGRIGLPDDLQKIIQEFPRSPVIWRLPDGADHHVVCMKVDRARGLIVLGPASEALRESEVEEMMGCLGALEEAIETNDDTRQALIQIRAMIGLTSPSETESHRPFREILDEQLRGLASRIEGLAVKFELHETGGVAKRPTHVSLLMAALLEHVLSELAMRPDSRAVRVSAASDNAGALVVRLTHNGVPLDPVRLKREAIRHNIQLDVVTAGPGLGLTYVMTVV